MSVTGWLTLSRTAHRAASTTWSLWPVSQILSSHHARLASSRVEPEPTIVSCEHEQVDGTVWCPTGLTADNLPTATTDCSPSKTTDKSPLNRYQRTGHSKSRRKGYTHLHPTQPPPHLSPTSLPSLYQTRTRQLAHSLSPKHTSSPSPPHWLARLLKSRNISPSTLRTWQHLLACRGQLPYVLETLGLLEAAGLARRTDVPCPDWLFLALPGLLRGREEAPYLVGLLLGERFGRMDGQNQGLFVARCVQHLLRAKHYVAAEEVVDWFVNHWGLDTTTNDYTTGRKRRTPRTSPNAEPWHRNKWGSRTQTPAFARVLTALTTHRLRPGSHHAPPPALLHQLASKLRTALTTRQLPPSLSTFLPLFSPSLLPSVPREAALLLLEMHRAGLTPPDSCLHGVMKVYAAAGDTAGADRIWKELEGRRGMHRAAADLVESRQTGFEVKWATTRLRALGAQAGGLGVAQAFFDELKEQHGAELDTVAWTELLRLVAMQKNLAAAVLVDVFDRFEAGVLQHPTTGVQSRPGLRSYTVLLQGLVRRAEHEQALEHWSRFLDSGNRPDAVILGLVARAMADSSEGGPSQAEEFLRQWAYKAGVDSAKNLLTRKGGRRGRGCRLLGTSSQRSGTTADQSLTRGHLNSVALDTVTVNAVLLAYSRAGQYRKVYHLWNTMADAFGTQPDMASLSIVLDCARFASARAGNGYGPGLESLEGKLQARAGADTSDAWEGRAAWKVAEGLMWDVLERNWPGAAVDDPMRGPGQQTKVRTTGGDATAAGTGLRSWLAHKLTSPPSSPASAAPSASAFAATLSPFSPPLYPHLHPTLPVFRSFIQLLGYHSSPHKVLAVFGWMKRLGVVPDRKLATLGLMYVGEVGLTDAELGRVRGWVGEWLGEGALPAEAEVAWMRSGGRRAR